MQLGDLSVADQGHVDAADRRRLFRNAYVEGEQPQVPAHVGRSCDGEHETGQAIEGLLRSVVQRLTPLVVPSGSVQVTSSV